MGTTAQPSQDPCERMLERIEEIGRLPNGWDGDAAVRPSLATIGQASRFVGALAQGVPAAAIAAAADGSIEFEWDPGQNGQAVAVAVTPDALILMAAFTHEGVISEEESDEPAEAARFVRSFLGGTHVGGR